MKFAGPADTPLFHAQQQGASTADTTMLMPNVAFCPSATGRPIRARQDGGYLPFADTLLPNANQEEKEDDVLCRISFPVGRTITDAIPKVSFIR